MNNTEALSIMRPLYEQTDTQPMRWLLMETFPHSADAEAALQFAVNKGWLYVLPGTREHERGVYLTLPGRRMVENDEDNWIRQPIEWRDQRAP